MRNELRAGCGSLAVSLWGWVLLVPVTGGFLMLAWRCIGVQQIGTWEPWVAGSFFIVRIAAPISLTPTLCQERIPTRMNFKCFVHINSFNPPKKSRVQGN